MRFLIAIAVLALLACTPKKDSAPPAYAAREAELKQRNGQGIEAPTPKGPTPKYADEFRLATDKINQVLLGCPARVWPNYDWKTINIVFVEPGAPTLVWRGETGVIETVADESQIPETARHGTYSFFDWKGQKTVSLNVADKVLQSNGRILQLATHEGFHYHGQDGWARAENSGDRGTLHPQGHEARLMRRMLYQRLKDYFVSKGADSSALGRAAYWLQQWKAKAPAEALSTTDGYEGTAEYFERITRFFSIAGCSASDAEILKLALESSELNDPNPMSNMAADSEGYEIGSLAGFILRLIKNDGRWYDEAKQGSTPVESLLKGVTPLADQATPEIESVIRSKIEESNRFADGLLSDELASLEKLDSVRIAIPPMTMVGSFSTYGFFILSSMEGVRATPLADSLVFSGSAWRLKSEKGKVMFSLSKTPCPAHLGYWITPVEKSALTIEGERAKIKSALLNGDLTGKEMKSTDGHSWFCVTP